MRCLAIRFRKWLEKTDFSIAEQYASWPDSSDALDRIGPMISEELRHLLRLTINGLAARMRTSG